MSKKKATVTNPTRVTTPAKSAPVTATAKTGDAPQNWLLNALAALLLIAYGYVTVITPNWMAFDSNATKFYTFAILNLIVVALVFLIKEFRDRTQVLFGFFSNKIGIAYCVIMVFALLSFSKAIDVEEAILHYSKIFIVFNFQQKEPRAFSCGDDFIIALRFYHHHTRGKRDHQRVGYLIQLQYQGGIL